MTEDESDDETEDEAVTYWETRYAGDGQIWSGEPNKALVDAVAGFDGGRALDLGCGEGGDSAWLAVNGWKVTAVDISTNAIARAKGQAARKGVADGQISWVVTDLADWKATETYELVSACFLHSLFEFQRSEVLRRAAGAVAPGGHLLVVGHADAPPWSEHQGHDHVFVDPAKELAELELDPTVWDVVVAELRLRQVTGPNGESAALNDSVLLVRRR